MAIESLPEPVSAEPSGKVLDWLNQQKNPEFDALRDLRAAAADERKVQYQVIDFIDGLRAAVAKSAEAFRNSATLGNFQKWAEAAHTLTAANSCWNDYSNLCSVLGSRCFETQAAKGILLAAMKKGTLLLNQKLSHIETVGKKAFLDGLLDWDSNQHQPIVSLRHHISKLRDASEECSLEMAANQIGQLYGKYGGLLPLK